MLSKEKILKIDPSLASLSEEDFERLKQDMYGIAQLGFDMWWARKGGSKSPTGSLTNSANSGIVNTCNQK
jgi:hypothetical protein